jgi:predicted DNA-binding antitoxin AbrB/MazE fold protein
MNPIHAVYEDGVFKPTEPVGLAEHSKVEIGDIRVIEPAVDAVAPAIEDVLADLAKKVTDDEWAQLPPDLTDKLDEYLYGRAKA